MAKAPRLSKSERIAGRLKKKTSGASAMKRAAARKELHAKKESADA